MKAFAVVVSFILFLFPHVSFSSPLSELRLKDLVAERIIPTSSLHVAHIDLFNELLDELTGKEFVSEFVVGKQNVAEFLLYHSEDIFPDNSSIIRSIDVLSSPKGIEMALFFFNAYYGKGQKMPVMIFDAAFDGEGIVTLEDLLVGLEYETHRIPYIMEGIKLRNHIITRDEYLAMDLQVKKTVLECLSMNITFLRIFSGQRRVSSQFFTELEQNFIKYMRILQLISEGEYWYRTAAGRKIVINKSADIQLAQAHLDQSPFTIGIVFNKGVEKEAITYQSSGSNYHYRDYSKYIN